MFLRRPLGASMQDRRCKCECMLKFLTVVHVPEVRCPKSLAIEYTEQAFLAGVVVERLRYGICEYAFEKLDVWHCRRKGRRPLLPQSTMAGSPIAQTNVAAPSGSPGLPRALVVEG